MQTTQYEKNPSGSASYVSRVARTGATVSTSTFSGIAGWPTDGASSHILTATGTGAATIGTVNTDRPAAAAGQKWSLWLRVLSAQARSVTVSIVFYNSAGATLGTAVGTFSDTDTFTANEIRTMRIDGALAPAGTASVDWQITRNTGSGAALADVVYYDSISLTRTDVAVPFVAAASGFATWTGTADASTQVYWTPAFTLTPRPASEPPYVEVALDDLPPAVDRVTVYRAAGGREHEMRGAIQATVVGSLSRIDWECPFSASATYRAEMFDSGGVSLGFTEPKATTLTSTKTWLHNPLDPQGAVPVSLSGTTGRELSRPVPGVVSRPLGRTVGVMLAEPRKGLEGLRFDVRVSTTEAADKVQALIGGYGDRKVPIICVRLGGPEARLRVTQPLMLGVPDIVEVDINTEWGGGDTRQQMVGDEVAPPAPGLFIPLLTAADINAYYATASAANAAYIRAAALDRDYTLAGYAS